MNFFDNINTFLRQYGFLKEARAVLRASLEASGQPAVAEELKSLEEVMRGAGIR